MDPLHAAFLRGDLPAVRRLLGDPPGFPNVDMDGCGTPVLFYALFHAPLETVRRLLEQGADADAPANDGFPALFCAIDSDRTDRVERVRLLLDHGADVMRRGVNDYTPLHQAATRDHADVVELLLARGADPAARTRIDHYGTALEEAERFGHSRGAAALRRNGVEE